MTEPPRLSSLNYKKDLYVIIEGSKNDTDRFFIIQKGNVRISKEVEVVKEEGGNILGPGDFFGVVSSMSSHSHIETAQTISDAILISVKKSQFEGLIKFNTTLAMKIIRQFSQRMRYLDHALTGLTLKSSVKEEDPDCLFKIGQYYDRQGQYAQAWYVYDRYRVHCPQGAYLEEARQRLNRSASYRTSAQYETGNTGRIYRKNAIFFAEGESGNELYILQSGSVKITKIVDNKEVILAVLKAGDMFGEMALLESKPRSASVQALEDCTALIIKQANFEGITATEPQIIDRLTQILAERIWLIYKQLANTLVSDPAGRMYGVLLMHLEKNHIPLDAPSAYTFDFGPEELAQMIGVSHRNNSPDWQRLLSMIQEDKVIQISGNKISVKDIRGVVRQNEYHRKMQQRQQNVRKSLS
jgi:CRP-like cAMP-binding protein